MNKRTGLTLIILTAILAACTAQAAPAPTEPTALPPTATAATPTQPSATARPTTVPTVTHTPLSPDAQALKDIVFSDCIPVEESLPEGFEIPWDLLVWQDGAMQVYSPEDGGGIKIPYFSEKTPEGHNKFTYDFFVSPDGKWLAYQNIGWTKVTLEPTGTLINNTEADRIVWDKGEWFYFQRWVDNETILVIYPPPVEFGFYPTVFLNPFTGEEHVFSIEELPDPLIMKFGGAVILTHYMDGEVVSDPTMKFLIYPKRGEDSNLYNVLWDIENENPLASLRFLLGSIQNPLWAQDGNDVLVKGPNPTLRQSLREEWFLISNTGTIRQITQFQHIFLDAYYSISRASRSQDGRFVVFGLYYEEPEKIGKYIVLDLKSNKTEGYCIPLPGSSSPFYRPVWSPDNKYVIISGENDDGKTDNILVDVENDIAYKIGEDMRVIGWIAKSEGEK